MGMRPFRSWSRHVPAAIALAAFGVVASAMPPNASRDAPERIRRNEIAGVVTGPAGGEPGVWVIAETADLPTRYTKIVVTDDLGRYLLPELPAARYRVWVRGYELLDSATQTVLPGHRANFEVARAPDPATAAAHYPAIYWYSLLGIPPRSDFPGTGAGPGGNGIPAKLKSQGQWLDIVKTDGCVACHQLGDEATRALSPLLGHFDSTQEAWVRRLESGQAGTLMLSTVGRLGATRPVALFADWTDRIAAGELPFAKPSRPQGIERNLVVTLWDWGDPKTYLHDEISTDRRHPSVNANGLIYGSAEDSTDEIPVLDPVRHVASRLRIPVRDPHTPSSAENPILAPSVYWGDEPIWNSQTVTHNPMFDERGRVWFTARIRPADNPSFCRAGGANPSARLFPLQKSGRQLAMYDPKSGKFQLIDTCFNTHHLQFANDADGTLWTSSVGGDVVGWLKPKTLFETGDETRAQGWTVFVLDTNGNGRRDEYVEPDQPPDPARDTRIVAPFYGVAPSPTDRTVWGSTLGFPGGVVRLDPGTHPPETALAEFYEVPWDDPRAPVQGYSPRGMDIDGNGVVWAPLASGHLASFDRRKCRGPLNGPTATGRHCPEGWTLYPLPGPQFKDVTDSGSAEASYYAWVDQHDTLGLGRDLPIATGNLSDALFVLKDGRFLTLRVPYPMGFFAKGLDGRIDDARAGWKGRGLWATYGTRTPFHAEGGRGTTSKVVHFQIRPDPLAH